MKKKALSLVLALVMCLGLTVPALAAPTVKEIVPAGTYKSVKDFSEGRAAVLDLFHWGFIDTTGKEVVPCQYYGAESFSEGLAAVRTQQWGFIDKTGREVIPFQYDSAQSFSEGLAVVESGMKYGYVDKTGREVVPCKYGKATSLSGGRALVYNSAEAYYGYIDSTGKEVIPCQYTDARPFINGYALVKSGSDWNVIDTTGKKMVPDGYMVALFNAQGSNEYGFFASGAEIVLDVKTNQYCVMDTAGRVVVQPGKYAQIDTFSEGLAPVLKRNEMGDGAWGFVDSTGKEIIPCQYASIRRGFTNGYAWVVDRTGREGFLDKTGKFVAIENAAIEYGTVSEGFIVVSVLGGGRQGVLNTAGQEIVPATKYHQVKGFSNGVAAVRNFDGDWGLIDTAGNVILPCQYREISWFGSSDTGVVDGFVPVMNEAMRWGFVSVSGTSTPVQPQEPAKSETAAPTNDSLTVNGQLQNPTVYKINGNNYFKIRDLAAVLNGTGKQFDVGYDGALKSVTATTGKGYAKQDTDLAGAATGGGQTADPSNDTIYIDGQKIDATVYKINGNNYFKLRDLGEALDFYVGWTKEDGVFIDTSKPYSD